MDEANLAILNQLVSANSETHAELFLHYAHHHVEREVPDPYYGGADGFERVLDMGGGVVASDTHAACWDALVRLNKLLKTFWLAP